jgi:hypothetical protein
VLVPQLVDRPAEILTAGELIPQRDALRLQLALIAGNEPSSSFVEVRCLSPDGRPGPRSFVPVREHGQVMELVAEHRDRYEVLIGAAPRVTMEGTASAVRRVWTLWGDFDGSEGAASLQSFRPAPSIEVASGSQGHRHGYWASREPVPPTWARAANRRIAYSLGADLKATDPARVLRAIGSFNLKHDPPVAVVCVGLRLDVFTLDQVVGGLPDPPQRRTPARRPMSSSSASSSAVLEGILDTLHNAKPGNRNACLHWCACRIADHAAEGLLDADDARERLHETGLDAGLSEHEVEATLRSGLGGRAGA